MAARQNKISAQHGLIALVLAVFLETALALIWAGQMMQKVSHIEERTEFIDRTGERIARLEENIAFMRASLQRLEQKIDSRLSSFD